MKTEFVAAAAELRLDVGGEHLGVGAGDVDVKVVHV